MKTTARLLALVGVLTVFPSCYQVGDLGDTPFQCTEALPDCPDGYTCDMTHKPAGKGNYNCVTFAAAATPLSVGTKTGSYGTTKPTIDGNNCSENDDDHTFDTSNIIGDSMGKFTGVEICPPGDVDIWSININAGEFVKVVLTYTIANGDLDMAIYDGNGNMVTGASDTDYTHDNACIALPTNGTGGPVPAGTYYVVIEGAGNTDINTYNLQMTKGSTRQSCGGTSTTPPDMSM